MNNNIKINGKTLSDLIKMSINQLYNFTYNKILINL